MCNEDIKARMCNRCGEEKPLTDEYFYKDKVVKSGFSTICKDCEKEKYKHYKDTEFNIYIWYENKTQRFKNNWNLEDIIWIYDNYLNINKQILIDKFPDSNYKTIHNIISQWDIRKIEKNDDWSQEDIDFLIKEYPSMPQSKLEDYFSNRTWAAIKIKANKLNIKRNEETLIKINSDCHKGYKFSEERKRNISKNRRGINSPSWKGGLTPLITYFRSILYEWKLDSLKAYDFKCAFTNTNKGDLEIHHSNENFSDMVYETFNILQFPVYENMLQYSEDELKSINKIFLELHYKNGLGIPLTKLIHKVFHIVYGLSNNTEQQFNEFKEKYFNGDFDEILEITNEDIKNKKRKKKSSRRLTENEVLKIKELLNKGFPITYISKEFGTKDAAIYNIKTGRSWKKLLEVG